jgi:hypothetical protein
MLKPRRLDAANRAPRPSRDRRSWGDRLLGRQYAVGGPYGFGMGIDGRVAKRSWIIAYASPAWAASDGKEEK